MSQAKVFVTRQLPEAALQHLAQHCALDVWPDFLPPAYEVLLEKVAGVDALLCLLTDRVDATLIQAGARLKVISNMAVGYDNIDVAAASARKIPVGNTPGVLTETTADFAFALLMAVARRIPEAQGYVQAGEWRTWHPTVLSGRDVFGATLGILGFGRIGQAMARRASGFGMRILALRRSSAQPSMPGVEMVSFSQILEESDFLSLHVPLTERTQHMIGADELQAMKRSAVLINTARGAVVDQAALAQALREGRILAAGLDVADPEPIPPDDPLLALPNCVLTPHIASASVATRRKMALMAAENVIAGLAGRALPHCVNPTAR